MNRMIWLDPLVNHLKQSSHLNDHGSTQYPDLNNTGIYVVADYDGFTEVNKSRFGIIISPMQGDPTSALACATNFNFQIMIGAMVQDVSNRIQNFSENIQSGITTQEGAYPIAARFEEQIRKAILDFNKTIDPKWKFKPLKCVALAQEYAHNGAIVMRTIYNTEFIF